MTTDVRRMPLGLLKTGGPPRSRAGEQYRGDLAPDDATPEAFRDEPDRRMELRAPKTRDRMKRDEDKFLNRQLFPRNKPRQI